MNSEYISKWHRELSIFYKLKPMLIFEGNVLDVYQYPADSGIRSLPVYLCQFLKDEGYQTIVSYQKIRGFFATDKNADHLERFRSLSGCEKDAEGGAIKVPFTGDEEITAPELIDAAVSQYESPTAVILEFTSRYITAPDNMEQSEIDSFTRLMLAAQHSKQVENSRGQFCKNLIICLVNKTNDLPAWFCLSNPYVQIFHLSTPDIRERLGLVAGDRLKSFFDREIYEKEFVRYRDKPEELDRLRERFAGLTEGFTCLELSDIRKLCVNERCHISQMTDMIDLYRYGIRENPWAGEELQKNLKNGMQRLQARVKGQDRALTHTLDVVKRAALGMSGLQHSSHTKPKGILFFAGPTGTGKTETAKTLAELIFGEERRCIRFDMSEYASPNSDQRLLGAPPGYVGYQAGGQLTNAVRENPFSILLFDEIEKAHSSIFDKFLQILEDGRMTDGQGRTVYFSETVIIFTSNLGIYRRGNNGSRQLNVMPEDPFEEVERKVRGDIEQFFKAELGRPEILNRIGENIVVFDFIREDAAKEILDNQLKHIADNLKLEKNIELVISDSTRETLFDRAKNNLANGGRGIGNVVENAVINPLARYLFDMGLQKDAKIAIESVDVSETPARITVTMEG